MPGDSPIGDRARSVCLLLAPALAALALLVGGTAPAAAHTDLVGSTPGAGDTVSLDTDRVVLAFGGPLAEGTAQVVVLDDHGVDTVDGPAAVSGQTLEVPLRLQRSGIHEVTYRVVSEDGHAVVGGFDFAVRAGSAAAPPAGPPPASGPPEIAAGTGAEQSAEQPEPGVPLALWAAGGLAVLVLGLVLARSGSRSAQGRPTTLEDERGVRAHVGEV